ncbi:MAG TPA: metallophosphoesterase family protein [Lunatimonas sp.]|nr:metallophosphoesterase family protein [Lunatimonas sp.]
MKKIALISDSHSHLDTNIFNHFAGVDEIWHAGDIGQEDILHRLPADCVKRIITGNIDDTTMQQKYPSELFFELEGLRILMIHIGGSPPRYAKGIKAKIKSLKPNVFVCGHSHICKVLYDKEMDCLYVNPGAVGNQGFHHMKTMLTFELHAGKVKNMCVVELGRRGKYPESAS